MIIGFGNSIRFRKVDANYTNFDNTLTANERFFNDSIFTYCQRFLETDTVTVQIKSTSNTVPTVKRFDSVNNQTSITPVLVSSYDQDGDTVNDLFFFEFQVPMAGLTDEQYLTASQNGIYWISEPFKADPELLTELQTGEAMKIEYYNTDNALQMDFSTGLTFKLYVEGCIKDYGFGGESSVYDNQDEMTKLKETMTRLMTFRTLYIPRYLAETIRIASGFDVFVVNGVSYVREDLPEITPVESSNLVEFSMTLNDKEYLGVNTHDIGFDCDNVIIPTGDIMVLTELNASGSVSLVIPEGYLIHVMRAIWVSGTSVEVKLGQTVGGDELVYPITLDSGYTKETVAIHADEDRENNTTIYATITGGVANIDVQLILNKLIP